MATTTNFGWTTPNDTDLVSQGAAAIRTLGSAIDTSMMDLKGGTTGQVLSKASNTDMDFTWVAQDDSNAIQNAIVDAKGDLITATAADTPARLAVGTNGQYLIADSTTATGLKWGDVSAGAYTSLASGTLSGSEVSLTSISGSYVDLYLVITNFYTNTGGELYFRVNNVSTATYSMISIRTDNTAAIQSTNNSAIAPDNFNMGTPSTASNYTAYLKISDYAKSSALKAYESGWNGGKGFLTLAFNSSITAAVTSIQIRTGTGQTFSGGTYTLYGVK